MIEETKKNKHKDKVYLFLEQHIIKIVVVSTLLLLTVNKLLLEKTYSYGWNKFDIYFTCTLKNTLHNLDGTLITIAAVFIGIYFTIFTLLSSIKIESTFSILTKANFNNLLVYIRNAFIGSFTYLLFSLFAGGINNDWVYTIIALSLLLYMLLSALRFGVIIYLIFNRDVKKYYDELEKEKAEKIKIDNLYKRLDIFLDDYEKNKQEQYSKEFSKLLSERNKGEER